MMEWIDLLTMMGIVMAGLSIVTAFAVLVNFARQALKQRKPKLIKVVSEKKKEEKPKMSKEKGEGVTFNDIFMFMIEIGRAHV